MCKSLAIGHKQTSLTDSKNTYWTCTTILRQPETRSMRMKQMNRKEYIYRISSAKPLERHSIIRVPSRQSAPRLPQAADFFLKKHQ